MKDPLRQTEKEKTFKPLDKKLFALPPGKRTTDWNTVYYERRANRSDKNKKLRL